MQDQHQREGSNHHILLAARQPVGPKYSLRSQWLHPLAPLISSTQHAVQDQCRCIIPLKEVIKQHSVESSLPKSHLLDAGLGARDGAAALVYVSEAIPVRGHLQGGGGEGHIPV